MEDLWTIILCYIAPFTTLLGGILLYWDITYSPKETIIRNIKEGTLSKEDIVSQINDMEEKGNITSYTKLYLLSMLDE